MKRQLCLLLACVFSFPMESVLFAAVRGHKSMYPATVQGDECSGNCGKERCSAECANDCQGCNRSACRRDDKCPGNCDRDHCNSHCAADCGICNRPGCNGTRCDGGCGRYGDGCKALCGGNCGGCDHGHCAEDASASCRHCATFHKMKSTSALQASKPK